MTRRRGVSTLGRTSLLVLAAAVSAFALAACGSSSSSNSAGSAGATSAGSAAAAGPPAKGTIAIGTICSCSGAVSASALEDIPQFVQAWTKYVNANGGINGHPVQVYVKDDANSSSTALQAAKALVEQDHVIAIAGEYSNVDTAFATYLGEKGVPVVGGFSPSSEMASNPDFFPSGTTAVPITFYAPAAAAKAEGKTKFALMYCAEAPVCATVTGPTKATLKLLGMSLAYAGSISATAPNYTAPCLAAKQGGADSMFVIQAPAVFTRVLDGCAQQGFTPAQVNVASNVTPSVFTDPNANGMQVIGWNIPLVDTSTPGAQLFHKIVAQYAPDLPKSQGYEDTLMNVFAGLELFRTVGNAQKFTSSASPADVKTGLYALKNETLGGIAPPLNFVKGKPTAINCWFASKIENKKQTITSTQPQCVPADQVAALYKGVTG